MSGLKLAYHCNAGANFKEAVKRQMRSFAIGRRVRKKAEGFELRESQSPYKAFFDTESLFIALGADVSEGRGSRVRVTLKDVRAVFHRPHPQRVTNKSTVRSVRRFLLETGVKL